MALTKKHFVAMAKVIRSEVENSSAFTTRQIRLDAIEKVAFGLADMAQLENQRFDRHKFLVACGLEEEEKPK